MVLNWIESYWDALVMMTAEMAPYLLLGFFIAGLLHTFVPRKLYSKHLAPRNLADLFRIFGDTTRIRILYSLFEGELCVGDISEILGLSQSSVSHQLRILKDSKLVKFRREGKSIFYSLDDEHVRSILNLGMEHLEE